jgi:hypothetical protein
MIHIYTNKEARYNGVDMRSMQAGHALFSKWKVAGED